MCRWREGDRLGLEVEGRLDVEGWIGMGSERYYRVYIIAVALSTMTNALITRPLMVVGLMWSIVLLLQGLCI